jgi:hypothetical protein
VGVHRETRAAHVAAPLLAGASPPVTHDETSKDLNSLSIISGIDPAGQGFLILVRHLVGAPVLPGALIRPLIDLKKATDLRLPHLSVAQRVSAVRPSIAHSSALQIEPTTNPNISRGHCNHAAQIYDDFA